MKAALARTSMTALVLLLAACGSGGTPIGVAALPASGSGTSSPGDRYDPAKMDFRPAVLSSERHTGAFAAGDALSMEMPRPG